MTVQSILANSGQSNSDLERALREISLHYLNYLMEYKLLVLSNAGELSGTNNITCYNTDDIVEFDDGGGPQLLPENIEESIENHELAHQSVDRYGYLFSIKE